MQEVEWAASPNYNSRRSSPVSLVVVHHTVIPTLEETVSHFQNPASQVSSHYVLGKDGRLVQMVKEEDRAWHAGVSSWKGREDCNTYSIGIEVVNNGDGSDPFTEMQYSVLRDIVGMLVSRYGIARDMVVGHRDIALPPGRKVDPAANFDWSRLSEFADRQAVEDIAGKMFSEYWQEHTGKHEESGA